MLPPDNSRNQEGSAPDPGADRPAHDAYRALTPAAAAPDPSVAVCLAGPRPARDHSRSDHPRSRGPVASPGHTGSKLRAFRGGLDRRRAAMLAASLAARRDFARRPVAATAHRGGLSHQRPLRPGSGFRRRPFAPLGQGPDMSFRSPWPTSRQLRTISVQCRTRYKPHSIRIVANRYSSCQHLQRHRDTMKFAQHPRSLALLERVGVRARSGGEAPFHHPGGSPRPMDRWTGQDAALPRHQRLRPALCRAEWLKRRLGRI